MGSGVGTALAPEGLFFGFDPLPGGGGWVPPTQDLADPPGGGGPIFWVPPRHPEGRKNDFYGGFLGALEKI